MLVICPTLKIDVLNMEQTFQTSYRKGDKVFYISPLNQKGQEELQDQCMCIWNQHWKSKNKKFETMLFVDPNLKSFSKHIFFCLGW